MSEQRYFENALSDFTFDVASGGAIRHLVDLDYSVAEIVKNLDYPTPYEKVQKAVWDYMIKSGRILLNEPVKDQVIEKVTYKKETGAYGRTSFRRVVTTEEITDEYLPVSFGLDQKHNPERYKKGMDNLNSKQREYVEGIPWIARTVYYKKDQLMREILEKYNVDNL